MEKHIKDRKAAKTGDRLVLGWKKEDVAFMKRTFVERTSFFYLLDVQTEQREGHRKVPLFSPSSF
jgi:hypothetical protein